MLLDIRPGDYISLRSRWVSKMLGYEIKSMTIGEWGYFESSEAGKEHARRRDLLCAEFDTIVWPKLLALLPETSSIGPFEPIVWELPAAARARLNKQAARRMR